MDVRIANIIIAVLLMTLSGMATDAGAQEKIYRWVDENGEVHFGDTPPQNGTAEQIEVVPDTVSTVPPASPANDAESGAPAEAMPSEAEQLRQERAEQRRQREAQAKELAKACEQQQKLVDDLEPSPRVIVKMKDGTVTRLDDDVRLKTLQEARDFIAKNCNK